MNLKEFADKTSIVPEILVETALEERGRANPALEDIDGKLTEKFAEHAAQWIVWFYENNDQWKEKVDSDGSEGLNWVYMWVSHWIDSFIKNPEKYLDEHKIEEIFG